MPKKTSDKKLHKVGQRKKKTAKRTSEGKSSGVGDPFKNLLKYAPFGMYLIDLKGTIIACNDRTAERLGTTPENAVGTLLSEHLPSDIARHRQMKGLEVIESGNPVRFEDQVDGRYYYNMVYPVFNEQGDIDALAVYRTDITDIKHIEKQLLESEERYQAIFNRSRDCYFICDFDGNFLDANDAALNLLGYEREEISSLNFATLLSDEQLPAAMAGIQEILDIGSQQHPIEVQLRKKNGASVSVESLGSLIYRNEKPYAIQGIARDISDRKKTDNALRESEEKYRTILNSMDEGYYEVDLAGNFTFFNEAMRNILGYEKNELMGMNYREYMDAENSRTVFNIFNSVYTTKKAKNAYDWELITKANGKRTVEVSISLMKDSHGNPSGFRGVVRDVTDRKKAEEALRQSEGKYRAILDSMVDAYSETDLAGNNVFFNRSAYERLGYSKEEYLRINYKKYTTPENAEKIFETYNRVYRTGEPEHLAEYEILTKDGRSLVCEASVILMKDKSGKPIGFRALSRDITERKHSEDQLKISLQTSDDIVKAIPSGLFIYRFEEPDKLFLIHGNPEAERLTGLKIYDWIEKEFNEIWPEAKKNNLAEKFLSPIKTGDMYENEELLYKDQKLEGAFRVRTFKIPGSRLGVAFENITEKKKLEEQVHQAQKMEAIGTLAGGIAHDFNNLLMGILGRSSLMMTDLEPFHPHSKHLAEIETYVKSAVDLTNQLLGFARGGKYEVLPTNINELIKRHNRMFGRTKKEIKIKGKYNDNIWTIEVDRGQMEQVLMNMYVNAWQAMPDGGDLFVSTDNIKIGNEYVKPFEVSPGKYVKISITDTGVGMNPEIKDKIFEPFFTTKEKGRGTGMGLSSAYGIIKNHNGFVTVYSEPGEGTTFNIYIPTSRKKVKKDKKVEETIFKGSSTILLIDDEEMVVSVGEKILKRLGYDVFTAMDGKTALEVYQNNKTIIDLVILDLIMPDMSGKETFESLIKINPKVKVLLASGYSLNGKAKEMLDQGCSAFIQKPFNIEQLSAKLKDVLGNT